MQKLKFEKPLIEILKNFTKINPVLIFRPGTRLVSRKDNDTLLAATTLPFEIEDQFIIADLSSFLQAYSLFNDPILSISQKEIVIEGEKNRLTYKCGSEKLDKGIKGVVKMPPIDVTFRLPSGTIKETLKAASILGAPEIVVIGDEGKIYLRVTNLDNPSATSYEVELEGSTEYNFSAIFALDRLIIDQDQNYEVDLALKTKKFSHFKGNTIDYWIALQMTSTFSDEKVN